MTDVAEDLLRRLAPEVLGALVRRHGQFATAEDAVQEALLQAAEDWRRHGVPENPRGWLLHRRVPADDRPAARRADPAASRGDGHLIDLSHPGRGSWRRCPADPRGRQPDPALPVLSPVARADGPDRAHPPGGRRVDHGGDRPGLLGLRGHHDPADHPGETGSSGQRRPVLTANRRRLPARPRRRPARALPDLQRGLRDHRRREPAAQRSDRGGDPADSDAAPDPAPTTRSPASWP